MIRRMRHSLLVAVAAAATACASAGTASSVQHNVVTAEELAPMKTFNVYDALTRIRPSFLRTHNSSYTGAPEPVHVYLDGVRTEGLDALKQVHVDEVREIRFYEPQDANTRFGTGNNGGAIAVLLKH